MHPRVLIPLLSLIAVGLLASVVAAREPDRRASQLGSLILLCAGLWSLFELFFATAGDAELAASYARWTTVGSLSIGPLVFHLLATSGGAGLGGLRRLLPVSYAASLLSTLVALGTDWVVAGAAPSRWGWQVVAGPGLPAVYASAASCPLAAAVVWLHRRGWLRGEGRRTREVALAGGMCFGLSSLTDFLLPLLGIPGPRLGCASLVAWGGVTGWSLYRFPGQRLAAQKFASEILNILPDGVALLRLDGRIRATNEKLAELAERPAFELMGMPIGELLSEVDDRQTGAEGERECELVTASDRRTPVSVARSTLADQEGQAIGHVLVVRDLREVVSLRSRLVASGRLVAIGQLAAGMAHEINNPIAYVRSNMGLLEQHWREVSAALARRPHGPRVCRALDEGPNLIGQACEGVDRVASIVREIGGFSRGGVVEAESADLAGLLDTVVRVAAPQLKQVTIERRYAERPRVLCVPQELMQVFLNLLLNASHAFDDGGTIRLSTALEGEDAVVEVADDGAGIDPVILERIFEPFFTTKPVGEGTGLGLSISQQIVASHGGSIGVRSEPGRGTTFRIRLPTKPPVFAPAAEPD